MAAAGSAGVVKILMRASGASMFGIKRERDAFDVMLAICQARDIDWLDDAIRQNCIEDRLKRLWCLLSDGKLHDNIAKYWSGAKDTESWARVTQTIGSFLEASGIEEPVDGEL
jgi:hypothetical protein